MAEFKEKFLAKLHKAMKDNVVVQNAIKLALASDDRQNCSNVSVVSAVDTVTDTPAQEISVQNGLSRRLQFLTYAASHLPRLPQELLNLPRPKDDLPIPKVDLPTDDLFIPVVEGSDISDVCKCHHNLRCNLHFHGEEYLYIDTDKVSRQNQSQEMSPLQVLFGFMGDLSIHEDVMHIPTDNLLVYVDDLFIPEDTTFNESVPFDLDFEAVDI